jgi:hypothetical protein
MQARQWTDQPAYRRTEGMLLPAPLLASAASRRRGACLLDRLTKRCRAGRAGHGEIRVRFSSLDFGCVDSLRVRGGSFCCTQVS